MSLKPIPSIVVLAASTLIFCGCIRQYRPPTPDEPHAIVKLRRVYNQQAGVTLSEMAMVGQERAFSSSAPAGAASSPRNDAILVHPGRANLAIGAQFSHTELRSKWETYYVSVPKYSTESYSCGTYNSPQTCTRQVTRYEQEPRQRWVTREETVVDASCSAGVSMLPEDGHTYLVEYTFQRHGVCRMSCFEQVFVEGGKFHNQRCPYAPTPEE